MVKTASVGSLMVACMVLGGFIVAKFFYGPILNDTVVKKEITAAAVNVQALERIREGNIDQAASLLETVLDGQIIVLALEPIHDETKAAAQNVLRAAKAYRTRYPEGSATSDATVKQVVSEVLDEVP